MWLNGARTSLAMIIIAIVPLPIPKDQIGVRKKITVALEVARSVIMTNMTI